MSKVHQTGSVYQFYIPEIEKYAICKYYDFKNLSGFHGLLAKVFDKFTDSPQKDIGDLSSRDWLFGARSMYSWPKLSKKSTWEYLGNVNSPEDLIVPDFKDVQTSKTVVDDESTLGPWYPIHNLTDRGQNCHYLNIKHLEHLILTTCDSLAWRTGMEFCRINRLQIEKYFDLENEGIRSTYLQMKNIPIYKEIPKDIRGRAISNLI